MMEDPATRALLDRAAALLSAGRVQEAVVAHERLLAQQPDLPDSWYNLGYLYQQVRRFDDALQAYGQALARGVGGPAEVHVNRAVVLADHLARPDEAERELRAALAADPRFVPALLNLGNLHEQRGEREFALQAYEAALAIDPGHPLALSRLPNLKAVGGAMDPLVRRLRAAMARPGASAAERADLGFGLGKALDGAGLYDEAFAAYSAANRASRESAGPGARYDRQAHERFVDRLIRTFAEPMPLQAPRPGRAPPVFICGMFRSGSTLAEQILASHPRVSAGGEIDLLPVMARRVLRAQGDAFARLDAAQVQRERDAYLDGIDRLFPEADLVTDKRPDNFLVIGLIKTLFPDAKIVHTQREPIDNCLSVFFLHLDHSMSYATDLADIAHWYGQYRRLMAHWKSLYADSLLDVDYDALVVEPQPVIAQLLEHVGLPWDDACLDFHRTKTIVRTPSAWQVRQPLYTRSSGRWRHYERHLVALRAALAQAVG